jgi:hypothetical protein
MDQDPIEKQPEKSKQKWIVVGIISGIVLLVIAIILTILLMNKPKEPTPPPSEKQEVSKEFTIVPGDTALSYAGNKVYDACDLISFDTVRKNITDYQKILDTIGTDQRPTQPLTIDHDYFDRDIPAVLGKDGAERAKGTVIGASGNVGISAFLSTLDSNCWYGQGEGISLGSGKTFVKTYVIQKPTPISGELLAYINSLKPYGTENGVTIYLESGPDNSGFATIIAINEAKDTVAVFKTGSQKIAEGAANDLIKALSQPPKGPLEVTYPKPWQAMPNPCELLTAADFERYTGKPASALAEDRISLTDVGDNQMQRRCERLEVERLNAGEISKSDVTVRIAKNAEAAKSYVVGLKTAENDLTEVYPLKQTIEGADEAYVKKDQFTGNNNSLEMRIGEVFLAVNVVGEAGAEDSIEAYTERMLPIAKELLERFKK